MSSSPRSPHLGTPAELQARIRAERLGDPFVVYRDGSGSQQLVPLGVDVGGLSIGRSSECDIPVDWDGRVSRVHAELRRVGGNWFVVDDGLSRNGTFFNGNRVVGRRRLSDGDQVAVGRTMFVFREPTRGGAKSTAIGEAPSVPALTPAQQRVLISLCRPYRQGSVHARPPTNQQIADELVLTVAAVKTHLRTLFQRFGLEELPQNEKRARLVEVAFERGAVSLSEL